MIDIKRIGDKMIIDGDEYTLDRFVLLVKLALNLMDIQLGAFINLVYLLKSCQVVPGNDTFIDLAYAINTCGIDIRLFE